MLNDINNGGSSSPDYLTVVGNTLYFTADDGTHGVELWKYEMSSGTQMVKDIRSGSSSSFPYSLIAVGNALYFTANAGYNGYELYTNLGIDTEITYS